MTAELQNKEDETLGDVSTLQKAKIRIKELMGLRPTAEKADAYATAIRERDNAKTNLATVTSERDAARSRVTELEQALRAAGEPSAQLTAANAQIAVLTVERDLALGRRKKAETELSRVESFCGLRGIDPSNLPAAANDVDDEGATLCEQWQRLTGAAKTEFWRKHESKLTAYGKRVAKEGI